MDVDSKTLARGILESVADDHIVMSIPHTDYRIHLVPTVPVDEIGVPAGKRIKGEIRAKALRIHPARGGGRFIEPVWGEPRIVAGKVLAVEAAARRVLVDVSVPMWVTTPEGQDYSVIHEGELVNFYVESGVTITPVE